MCFQTELVPATLIKRYKRFLADCRLDDGRTVTAHCANPGSMLGLCDPGQRIWLEPNDDPRKKLKFGWRLVEQGDGHFVGVDTSIPNRVVGQALRERSLSSFAAYATTRAEVKYGPASRIDFLLQDPGLPDFYIEVKSVTLSRAPGLAEFPDAVTTRGAKHLDVLADIVRQGQRAAMLYLVQRTDAARFALADDIDPRYQTAFVAAREAGVETYVYRTKITPKMIKIATALTPGIEAV